MSSAQRNLRYWNRKWWNIFLSTHTDGPIGRTSRHSAERTKEHNSVGIERYLPKLPQSSIIQLLVDIGHSHNIDNVFLGCYCVPCTFFKMWVFRLLYICIYITEAVGVKIFKPNLCARNKFFQNSITLTGNKLNDACSIRL